VSGEIKVCGRYVDELSSDELQRCIQVVNQDPFTHFLEPIAIDDLVSYAEKFYGGRSTEVVQEVAKVLRVENIISKPLTSLSGGQLRRLAIAKALLTNPSIVILDEPFMWLDDVEGIELVLTAIDTLAKLGVTMIIVEHRFLRLLDKVRRVYLLKNGVLAEIDKISLKPSNTNNVEIGSTAQQTLSKCIPTLELENLWFKYEEDPTWILKNINLRVCQGDTVVIYGRNGSGKSTLLRIIAGLLKPVKGRRKRYKDVLYVPQIPYLFITEDSIVNEVKELCKSRKLGEKCIHRGLETLKMFGFNNLDTLPLNLSWGQQVRLAVLLAYTVAEDCILLLDEPFTGSTYVESFNLVNTLSSLNTTTKIITLSSKDYIPLFSNAKIYTLSKGSLEPLLYSDNTVFSGVKITHNLFS
ncbi:MAG: ATP-binding cassette domain-containing protein, partial [Ignisphaera sp.]